MDRPQPGPDVATPVALVVFDFDGVVADSEVLSLSTLRTALAGYGVRMTQDEVMRDFLGRSFAAIHSIAETRSPDRPLTGLTETWQAALFDAFRQSLAPIGSVITLLDHLDRHRVPYCVASSSSHERMGVALEAMNLTGRFQHLFSAEDVDRGKPFPDLFLHAADKMGVAPEGCLVIEDSPYGVEAARRANMRCLGFVGGSHLAEIEEDHARTLLKSGAEAVVSSHETLLNSDLGLMFSGS